MLYVTLHDVFSCRQLKVAALKNAQKINEHCQATLQVHTTILSVAYHRTTFDNNSKKTN